MDEITNSEWAVLDSIDWQHEHAWDMAEGYATQCIRCHRVMKIAGFGPSQSLICEKCEPDTDLDF